MKSPKPTTVDFETAGIQDRPRYPPVPAGVSIKPWGKKAKYYGWGHLTDNNCTWGQAQAALKEAYACKDGVLFQNGKFDVDVAEVHMGLPVPPWAKIHDTMFLLFLDDPHQRELGLKPSAERLLGSPPEERDEVVEWLVANQPVPGVKISRSTQSDHYAMKYLPYAPGSLVGKYANGDSDRTEALFKLLWSKTVERGMLAAYDRERRLMPILLQMERRGIQVDLERLRKDVPAYGAWRERLDVWVRKYLGAPELNVDSGEALVQAMLEAGKCDEALMPRTPTGKFQSNKEALLLGVADKTLLAVLRYRASLKTCHGTFMESWLAMADETGGTIHTQWNQTRGGGEGGTRTGRLSATWFMNIPKEFDPLFDREAPGQKLPKLPASLKGLPPLPRVRSYIIPGKGRVFIDRDYSQQEPRILAHFDGGSLMEKYLENPWVDFHDYAKAELEKMGRFYERKPVKNTNLGLIYGMGGAKLAIKNDMSVAEATELKKAILTLYPGLKQMYADMKARARNNEPIRTWGGREYYCEEPKLVQGRIMHFDYKLVNVLIQGSAADCTKEAIIRFDDKLIELGKSDDWHLVLNVHDQLTAVVPIRDVDKSMEHLRAAMQSIEFDVQMLSEGAVSQVSWDDLQDYDKKGIRL